MTTVTVDEQSARNVMQVIQELGFNVRKELAIAVNTASKTSRSRVSKRVYEELATTQKSINKQIKRPKLASVEELKVEIVTSKSDRIPLHEFGARHVAGGISAQVSRTKGRKIISGGFMGPKPGAMAIKLKGRAYKRKGKARYPIVMMRGASPWGVIKKDNRIAPIAKLSEGDLKKEIIERVRFLTLKAQGKLKGNQKK